MWVRKTEEDLKVVYRESLGRRKNPIVPLAIGLFFALLELIYEPTLVYFLVTFIFVFILAYLGQLFFDDALRIISALYGDFSDPQKTDICTSCFEVKKRDETKVCLCGGFLEPLDNWKWIEKT
jgi:hypothetical protein